MGRPNIIFYFTDQQRWDTVGVYGQKLDITPTLDVLAQNGILFTEAYSPQPVCGPCRAIFQTGRYPTDIGCYRNNQALPLDVKTVANYLTEAGYDTAYVGKWHLASDGELESKPTIDYHHAPIPLERRGGYNGFWRASDVLEFTSHGYGGYVFDEHMQQLNFEGYRVDCITDYALDFLKNYRTNKPFFLTLSHIEPHHQNDHNHYEGPVGSKERYKNFELPGDLKALGGDAMAEYSDYLGCCRSLDDNLARLIQVLKDEGIYEDTIIIFASDHGSHFRTRNLDEHKNGYDDYKRSCHSACLRVPLVMSGAHLQKGKKVKDLVSTASLPKTILALAGVEVGDQMIGENLILLAENCSEKRPNRVFAQISESRVGRCVRTPKYLYSVYAPGIKGGEVGASDIYADDFLYDLTKDPHELVNLIHQPDYQCVKVEMRMYLIEEMIKAGEKLPIFVH